MEQGADFQQILSSPTEAYAEGLRFFMGKGLLNNALRSVASDLEAHGIDYSVIGAIALNLASGMTAPDRLKDLADVQELIKTKSLDSSFATRLDTSVQNKFVELQKAVQQTRQR